MDAVSRWRALRSVIITPIQLVPLIDLPLLVVARHFGYLADVPLWVMFGIIVFAQLSTSVLTVLLPPFGPRWTTVARVGWMIAVIAAGSYVTGWGSVLSIGFVFAAAEQVRVEDSRAAKIAVPWILAAVLVGEVGIAVHWIPSLLPEPQGHGLAVLSTLGACTLSLMIGWTTAAKERLEASLRNGEERFRALLQHSSDVIYVIGIDRTFTYLTPSARRLGFTERPADGRLIHPDDRVRIMEFVEEIAEQPGAVGATEGRMIVDGFYRWFEIRVSNRLDDPTVEGLVCNMRDITERKEFEDRLALQAYTDELTELPNRAAFLGHLEGALAAARRDGGRVGLLFLDVDRFKLVNDSLGHEIGDRLLVEVAERLSRCLRPGDVVARFGGDEFTVMVDHVEHVSDVIAVAERITDVMAQPITVGTREIFVSTSVGIAYSDSGHDLPSDLLRQADLAMYLAKEKGRSRWEMFDAQSAPHVVERLELEGELWRALENEELVVRFQPEVELVSGRVVTAEALVRWQHPRRGLLDPGSFVPFAEESSLIVAIDRYVLRAACERAKDWSEHASDGRRVVVSVNLSPRFMRQADVVSDITTILRESGVDPRCVQLEITERTALTDVDATVERLHELRALGIRVAIDDFGTGYSSLGYLKRLPVDVVKLDRSFVESMDTEMSDVAIVQAVITMGHALGMKVTAEGVERPEQAARLSALGCDSAMGWLWSPALPPNQLPTAIRNGFSVPGAATTVATPQRRTA